LNDILSFVGQYFSSRQNHQTRIQAKLVLLDKADLLNAKAGDWKDSPAKLAAERALH